MNYWRHALHLIRVPFPPSISRWSSSEDSLLIHSSITMIFCPRTCSQATLESLKPGPKINILSFLLCLSNIWSEWWKSGWHAGFGLLLSIVSYLDRDACPFAGEHCLSHLWQNFTSLKSLKKVVVILVMTSGLAAVGGISKEDAGILWYCTRKNMNATSVDVLIATRKKYEYFPWVSGYASHTGCLQHRVCWGKQSCLCSC